MWQPSPGSPNAGLCKYTNYCGKYVHIAWFPAAFQTRNPQAFSDMNLQNFQLAFLILQSVSVALFSGVVATLLFFEATNLVKDNPKQLAVVEATQAGEVLFTLLGGILFLRDALPGPVGFLGVGIVVLGMILNCLSD